MRGSAARSWSDLALPDASVGHGARAAVIAAGRPAVAAERIDMRAPQPAGWVPMAVASAPMAVGSAPLPSGAGAHAGAAVPAAELLPQLQRPLGQRFGGTPIGPLEEARLVLEQARQTAQEMIAHARSVADGERDAARAEGWAAGHADGMAEADREMAGLVATCERIGVHVMEERDRLLAEAEGDIVELALAISERVVGVAVEIDPDLVVETCRAAMRKAFQRERMTVLVHPDDLERIRAAGPDLVRELGGIEHFDVVAERRLTPGSVIVRTPAGEIDATMRGKADVIGTALREAVEGRRAVARSTDA